MTFDPAHLALRSLAVDQADVRVEDIVPERVGWSDWIEAGALAIGSLVVALIVYRVVVRIVGRGSPRRLGSARLVGRFAGLVVFATGVVYALNALGVRIAPLLGALGIVGIALAFALRDILENFVAGIILQARSPFRYGDQIESNDWQGTVEDINFRAIVLRSVEGTRVVLPSSSVLKSPIHTLTAFDHRRTTIAVGVAYGTDLPAAAATMRQAVAAADGVLADPGPEVLLEELAENSINFAVRFWHAPQIEAMWHARDAVITAVYGALNRAGVEIPFPQRTVSFREQPTPTGNRSPVASKHG